MVPESLHKKAPCSNESVPKVPTYVLGESIGLPVVSQTQPSYSVSLHSSPPVL